MKRLLKKYLNDDFAEFELEIDGVLSENCFGFERGTRKTKRGNKDVFENLSH